jgi:uncharacterized protein (DUF433 family)
MYLDTMTILRDNKLGGDARIEGTRIGVYHICQYRDAGYSIQEIADEYELAVEEVKEAVEYARHHDVDLD